MTTSLKEKYVKTIAPELRKSLGLKNNNAVPHIVAVHINVGVGSAVTAGRDHEEIVKNIAIITGQKPIVTRSRKAISNFKLKVNTPAGVIVTLRGKRMYDFINKLVNVVLPRIRDFRGISDKSFDGHGNYSIGISEHSAFPEIRDEDISKIHGLQVTIQTSAKDNEQALALLKAFGFPFKK